MRCIAVARRSLDTEWPSLADGANLLVDQLQDWLLFFVEDLSVFLGQVFARGVDGNDQWSR